jgi:hypothetical protein
VPPGVFIAAPVLSFRWPEDDFRLLPGTACPDAEFSSYERDLLLEHARSGCITLWCVTNGRALPFVFLPRTLKGVMPCAQLVYCNEVDDFTRFAGPIGRFLAVHGRLLVLVDANGPLPGLVGKYLPGKMPKYFKGPDRPRLGDLSYTEAAFVRHLGRSDTRFGPLRADERINDSPGNLASLLDPSTHSVTSGRQYRVAL